jgi:glucosamine-6-phosphate deaminase
VKWQVVEDYQALSAFAGDILLRALRAKPDIVLGLPTGRTPEGMYEHIVAECGREYRCFNSAQTFNLDEYVGIPSSHPGSYSTYMRHHLFDHVDIRDDNVHIPDGTAQNLEAECARYELEIRQAGGLDLTFLGLGRNGHIGFNEPGTPFDSRTRVVGLTESTRRANAPEFQHCQVPTRAITIGIGTILDSKQIVLFASGTEKAEIVWRFASEDPSEALPATALRCHPDVTVIVDRRAAAELGELSSTST